MTEILEPSITKIQPFVCKVKAPQKICHLMWQLLTCHVAVTRNLTRRNIRCDNYCLRRGEPEETVSHAISECPPAFKHGLYHQRHQTLTSSCYQVSMPTWTIFSGGKTSL